MSTGSRPIWDSLEEAAAAFEGRPEVTSGQVIDLPLDHIQPDPNQPRPIAEPETDAEILALADSIRTVGFVLEPILVEPDPEVSGQWRIVAGERRYHASRLAGMSSIRSLLLTDLDEPRRLLFQLIENLHRKDLDLLPKARAFQRLKELTGLKAKDVAKQLGVSESSFSAHLRVLKATGVVLQALEAKMVANTETCRLLTELPEAHQERLVRDAIRERTPLSRPALERLRDRLAAEKEKDAGSSGPKGPAASPAPSPPAAAAAPSAADGAAVSVGLDLRHWRRLFALLGLDFPEDPERLPQVLFELLAAPGEDKP
ncbi:MAG TPA: ParB/RepB/Spo0J family partition protein [Thermoanaerobaculia bacterium]|nr:ParB/RepB/Spo0J family partition protein [Thermoanaerobaculia bacterium]